MKSEEELFQRFRPFCSALASKPSLPILEQLQDQIHQSNVQDMTRLQEYIVFPMQVYLKSPSMPENYTLKVLEFIADFFTLVKLESSFFFKDVLNSCLVLVMSKKEVSEDMKIAISKMFDILLQNGNDDVIESVLEEELKLPLSHLIFLTLEWAEEENESRNVVMMILEFLHTLTLLQKRQNQAQYKSRMAPMLPGISTRLVKITKKSFHAQSYKIKVRISISEES